MCVLIFDQPIIV